MFDRQSIMIELVNKDLRVIDETFLERSVRLVLSGTAPNISTEWNKLKLFIETIERLSREHRNIKFISLDLYDREIYNALKHLLGNRDVRNLSFSEKVKLVYDRLSESPSKSRFERVHVNVFEDMSLSEREEFIEYIETVSTVIKMAVIHKNMINLMNNPPKSFSEYAKEMYDMSRSTITVVSQQYLNKEDKDFETISTSSKDFLSRVQSAFVKLSSENSYSTGYKDLDKILSGGFQKNRVYTLIGLPGSGKSTILLNMGINVWKYIGKTAKDNKKHIVYYITLENSMDETLIRFASAVTENKLVKNNISILHNVLENNPNAEFIVEYYKPRSINPIDVLNKVREIESDGTRKVDMVIIDYVGKMGYGIDDLNYNEYQRLGMVVDDLKFLSINADLVVLTAHQFNRGAKERGTSAGHENVGGSWKIVENSDVLIYSYRKMESKKDEETDISFLQPVNLSVKKNRFGMDDVKFTLMINFEVWRVSDITHETSGNVNQRAKSGFF